MVSGNLALSFLSGKHSTTVVHTISTSYRDFSFIYHNTTWLDPGAGIWMHLQLGRDPIQAACFLLAFFLPSSLVLKKKTYTQQCTTLGSSPRQKLLCGFFADIPRTFFFLFPPYFLYLFGLERLLGRYPYGRHTTDTLTSLRSLACFPIHDDIILMTTSSTTR